MDPGTDHMRFITNSANSELISAMRLIDRVKKEDGKILSFTSYCGGLPAPGES